jgi:hypothetical protein
MLGFAMPKAVTVAFGVLLIVHGLVHLMGTAVYTKLGSIEGLPYKTTLLDGRWELGERGMRLFGALWVLPALGFVIGGAALLVGQAVWVPLVVVMSLVSLVMTVLDFRVAFAGAILNMVILAILWLGPTLRSRLGG